MEHWMATRRGALAVMGAAVAIPTAAATRTVRLIAGTYAREGGRGLYPVSFDPARDDWRVGAPLTGIVDASFGLVGPGGSWLLLRERSAGAVSAYASGWTRRGTASTGGADPCHAALDGASGCLAVANYSSGDVALHRLDPRTGAPGEPTLFRHAGSGPDRERQAGPHAHWVGFSPDRRWLHAVDLGADAIFAYPFDPRARTLSPPSAAWRAPPGSGPRHAARHPRLPRAYVLCELSNTLVMLAAAADGRFAMRRTLSTLPRGHAGPSQAAHIAIDRAGRRLYVSNRGHDSIAVFALDGEGMPALIQHMNCGGHWPRFFLLLERERRLVVANQRSGDLAVFRIESDGRLAATGRTLRTPGVAFLGETA